MSGEYFAIGDGAKNFLASFDLLCCFLQQRAFNVCWRFHWNETTDYVISYP